ncbi:MAG: heparinase II/III family protein, partial [Bacteroidales bacterium]|nr:heparinase II/III family protein [Bacteroidales bacterium]
CGPGPGHANQAKPERISNRGYGPGHQQPNINHFVIYANGTWLAIDPGYTHLKETRNHNTILVNGRGQAGAGKRWLDYLAFQNREPAPKIMLAETTLEYDYIIGNAGNIYVNEAGLEYFERQLMFIKPDVIIIADRLKGKANSSFEWLLQANEIANIEKMPSGYEVKKDKASISVFPLLPSGVFSEVTERMVEANDVHGSPDYDQDEALLRTIKLKTSGIETTFLVVLTVNKPGDTRPVVSINDGLIRIVKDGEEILVKHHPERELSVKILDF